MIQIITNSTPLLIPGESCYEFYLAVSDDSIVVLDHNRELVEWIAEGNDTDALVLACDDEDSFLDAILIFKDLIRDGLSPKRCMEYSAQP